MMMGWIARRLKGNERWYFLAYGLILMAGILMLVAWGT